MKIAIGTDWVANDHKSELFKAVQESGHEILDMGGFSPEMNDYPDFAKKVGDAVREGKADRGILICGTGIGMSIAANKIPGVRAALCHDEFTAKLSRRHNDANVLVFGAWVVSPRHAKELFKAWMSVDYDGGRHEPRLKKIGLLDEGKEW